LVGVVDLSGKKTVLSEGYWGLEGLAWSSNGDEVLYSGGAAYSNFDIYAVNLAGKRRVALQSPGGLTIQDVAADGRWIASRDDHYRELLVLAPGQDRERDLSWLDLSYPASLSPDGKTLLFTEENDRMGANYSVCLSQTDGSPVVRLGEGTASDLSRDGSWALAVIPSQPQQLVLYPTGAGQPRKLERGGLVSYESAQLLPDGRSILACGHEEGQGVRCYVQSVAGGKPRPVTPEGTSLGLESPDGRWYLVSARTGGLLLFPAAGGDPRPVPGATPEDVVVRWSADGRSILVGRGTEVPLPIERLDIATGRREPFRTLGPSDLTGAIHIGPLAVSEDGKSHAYACRRMASHLFLVEGAR
jgi:Tol biopolymer transport system component